MIGLTRERNASSCTHVCTKQCSCARMSHLRSFVREACRKLRDVCMCACIYVRVRLDACLCAYMRMWHKILCARASACVLFYASWFMCACLDLVYFAHTSACTRVRVCACAGMLVHMRECGFVSGVGVCDSVCVCDCACAYVWVCFCMLK